jgi:hypothetical protein
MPGALKAYETALAAATSDAERCRAWIGCAQVKRVTDDIDGAFADLLSAEAVAIDQGLKADEARVKFIRGNLLFPRGDIDGCFREHARSLELAREAGIAEHEAAALGGLGDAEYMRGRMISAAKRLGDCVDLSHQQGFGRIEVANGAQLAHTLMYFRPLEEPLTLARRTGQAAARVGHLRAQLNADAVLLKIFPLLGQWDACGEAIASARDLVARLGAPRWEQVYSWTTGVMLHGQGKRTAAVDALLRAADIARRTGIGFFGPAIQGTLALAQHDPDRKRAALGEGEALIASGCVGHNQLHFYPAAIDASLELSDFDGADRYASALESFASAEPMPWTEFFVRRARMLAATGRGHHEASMSAELRDLLEQGETFGYATALPAIRDALVHLS